MKKVLMIMIFICCIAAEEEVKTAAQWLVTIQQEQQARLSYEKEHPEARDLILGCALDLKHRDVVQDAYQQYQAWWKQEGQDSFGKWRKDGYPEIEGDAWYIFHAKVMNNAYSSYRKKKTADLEESERADLAYYERICKSGIAVLKKGYTGALLTRDEIKDLRLYAIYNLFIQGTMHPHMYRPWCLGLISGKSLNLNSGVTAPGFSLDPMEAWLESPEYVERNDFDFADMFRPAALTEFLQLMSGYEKGENGRIHPKPYTPVSENPVQLSDYADDKPVMLIFMDPVDSWWYWGKMSPAIEPLYRAAKGRIDFFFVATTIHDRYDPMMEFFKPDPGKTTVSHPWSMEERARRCKVFYMAHPNITIPYLLDDLAGHMSTAYRDRGGECVAVLVDKKGTVAFVSSDSPGSQTYGRLILWM